MRPAVERVSPSGRPLVFLAVVSVAAEAVRPGQVPAVRLSGDRFESGSRRFVDSGGQVDPEVSGKLLGVPVVLTVVMPWPDLV